MPTLVMNLSSRPTIAWRALKARCRKTAVPTAFQVKLELTINNTLQTGINHRRMYVNMNMVLISYCDEMNNQFTGLRDTYKEREKRAPPRKTKKKD